MSICACNVRKKIYTVFLWFLRRNKNAIKLFIYLLVLQIELIFLDCFKNIICHNILKIFYTNGKIPFRNFLIRQKISKFFYTYLIWRHLTISVFSRTWFIPWIHDGRYISLYFIQSFILRLVKITCVPIQESLLLCQKRHKTR